MEQHRGGRDPALPHWSHTRETTLRSCARRYFYRYLLARNGWRRSAPPRVRHAYVLSKLTTLDLALGQVLHVLGAQIVSRVLAGLKPPSAEMLQTRARAHLNQLVRNSRNLAAFAADPAGHPVLVETYYGRDLPAVQIERMRSKLERCTRNLAESTVWPELEKRAAGQVHVVDTPRAFPFGGATVWVAPDLVYTPAAGPPILLDWKTGRATVDTAVEQLGVYAAFARVQLELAMPATGYEGQIAELLGGERWSVPLTADTVAAAEARVREGVRVLATLPDDPEQPGAESAYPQTEDRSACRGCAFWALCAPSFRS